MQPDLPTPTDTNHSNEGPEMPNYCSNTVYINGPTSDIEDFLARIPRSESRNDLGYDLLSAFLPPDDDRNCEKLWGATEEVLEVRISTDHWGDPSLATLEVLADWRVPVLALEALAAPSPAPRG